MSDPVSLAYRVIGTTILAAIAVALWLHFKPNTKSVGSPTIAQEAPQLAHIATESIKLPSVRVFKSEAKKKVPLPVEIQNNQDLHVIASSKVPINLNPQNVTSVINEKTGEVTTFITREPLPWLRAEQTGEARIDYGWKGARSVARLSAREDLLQVKALHAGVDATLDSDGQYFVGFGVGYRW